MAKRFTSFAALCFAFVMGVSSLGCATSTPVPNLVPDDGGGGGTDVDGGGGGAFVDAGRALTSLAGAVACDARRTCAAGELCVMQTGGFVGDAGPSAPAQDAGDGVSPWGCAAVSECVLYDASPFGAMRPGADWCGWRVCPAGIGGTVQGRSITCPGF